MIKIDKKKISVEDLSEIIKPGSRIFLSSGPATPLKILQSILASTKGNMTDLEFIQLAMCGESLSDTEKIKSKFRLKTFVVGENIGLEFTEGNVDFIPTNVAELPYLFVSGAVDVDVAIVQTSLPDKKGFLNLGMVNDISRLVIESAPLVIAEMNPEMPITNGSTAVEIEKFDYLLESDFPLLEYTVEAHDENFDRIGWYVSNLVEDGSTLALGAGLIFNAVASHLKKKKGLRICSHSISDWIIDLAESGSIARKSFFNRRAPILTTACLGTKRLYSFINKNPDVALMPLLQSSYQTLIPSIKNLVSVLNVKKIDLSGDLVLIKRNEFQIAGFDGKLNFAIAATQSRGGKAIVALPSEDENAQSNIVLNHRDFPGRVRSTLGAVRYVVTEYGAAYIFGKTVRERAIALIQIAHPRHREKLIEEAKASKLIYADQMYNVQNALNYPLSLEKSLKFKNNLEVVFRPIRASDEDMMRRLFYQFSSEARYMRYFSAIIAMPHVKMQPYVNIDYDKTLSLVGLVEHRGIERIIAECRYAYDPDEDEYEMAFVVDESFQGIGLGTFMLQYLFIIAAERKIERLVSYVLTENVKMISVLRNARLTPEEIMHETETKFVFYINEDRGLFQSLSGR